MYSHQMINSSLFDELGTDFPFTEQREQVEAMRNYE